MRHFKRIARRIIIPTAVVVAMCPVLTSCSRNDEKQAVIEADLGLDFNIA